MTNYHLGLKNSSLGLRLQKETTCGLGMFGKYIRKRFIFIKIFPVKTFAIFITSMAKGF